jgi:hypothetical protein
LIKQELLLEHSYLHSNYLGTSLDTIEKIHQLERICLITVRKDGLKVLKSKHFPAKYVHCQVVAAPVASDPPTTDLPATAPLSPSSKSSREEKTASAKETKEESPYEHFDFTIDPSDSSSLEKLHSEVVEWFPELGS